MLLMISVVSFAQNNSLVVYSQDGLKFTLILNGIRQNGQPETNVKVNGLNAQNYQVKLIFENKMADVNQNAYLMYGGEATQNTEYTYGLENKNGTYKLKFKSAAPMAQVVNTVPEQRVVMYSPVDVVSTTTTTTNVVGTNTQMNTGNVNMNVNGMGVGVNVNVNGMEPMGTNVTNTSTTTYSSTTTTTNGGGMNNGGGNTYVLQGYNGVYGCPYPMSQNDFEAAKQSIKSKGFDDTRLTIAKQIIGSNCLLCTQIKEMMLLMSFEETRLELAKFAWHHNLDKGNYYKLNDAFSFESSIDELNQYTQSH